MCPCTLTTTTTTTPAAAAATECTTPNTSTTTSTTGPALMVVWSKALPLTASSLSPYPGFKSWPGQVASDLGLGSGFQQVLRFPG